MQEAELFLIVAREAFGRTSVSTKTMLHAAFVGIQFIVVASTRRTSR